LYRNALAKASFYAVQLMSKLSVIRIEEEHAKASYRHPALFEAYFLR